MDSSDTESIENFPIAFEHANDTTAEQYNLGRDIQGIPWERLRWTRKEHRKNRVRTFINYTNLLSVDGEDYKAYEASLDKISVKHQNDYFYDFVVNSRRIQSTITHFQLRNLIWSTTKHDVYVMYENCIYHWDLLSSKRTQVLNLQVGKN